MKKVRVKKPMTLGMQCASREIRLWMLSETLPRKERALIRNYMKIRDALEARAVKQALHSQALERKQ